MNLGDIVRLANAIATYHTTQQSLAEADAEKRRQALLEEQERRQKTLESERDYALKAARLQMEAEKEEWARHNLSPYQQALVDLQRQTNALNFANQYREAFDIRAKESEALENLRSSYLTNATTLAGLVKQGHLDPSLVPAGALRDPSDVQKMSPEELRTGLAQIQGLLSLVPGATVTLKGPGFQVGTGPGKVTQDRLAGIRAQHQEVATRLNEVKLAIAQATKDTEIAAANANLQKTLAQVEQLVAQANYLATRTDLLPEELELKRIIAESVAVHRKVMEDLERDRVAISRMNAETSRRLSESLNKIREVDALLRLSEGGYMPPGPWSRQKETDPMDAVRGAYSAWLRNQPVPPPKNVRDQMWQAFLEAYGRSGGTPPVVSGGPPP